MASSAPGGDDSSGEKYVKRKLPPRKSLFPALPRFLRNRITRSVSESTEPQPDPVHGVASEHRTDILNGHRLKGTPYRIGRRIGSGSFGQLRMARNIQTDEKLAVKIEPENARYANLNIEWQIYKILNKTPAVGIPRAFHYGPCGWNNALVMELLGPSLEQIFKLSERKFSLHTVLMIAVQLITRIQYVHSQDIIHRDIKPDNLLINKPPHTDKTIYLIDFGLSKLYRTAWKSHIEYKENRGVTGTMRFMSINAHLGIELSRRDDLESVGYTLIYFLRGSLPWQGILSHERDRRVLNLKRTLPVETICEGQPPEFVQYMQYVRKLEFKQTPDYEYLRGLFITRLNEDGLDPDGKMDWSNQMSDKKRARLTFSSQSSLSKRTKQNKSQVNRKSLDREFKKLERML